MNMASIRTCGSIQTLSLLMSKNIRDGFVKADPEGAENYTANADAYIDQLKDLNTWIVEQELVQFLLKNA